MTSKFLRSGVFAICALFMVACGAKEQLPAPDATSFEGATTRGPNGLLKIRAADFYNLGALLAHENARAHFCDMTQTFIALSGQQSFYFGASPDRLAADSVAIYERTAFETVWAMNEEDGYSRSERDFIEGFVEGFNRYLGAAVHTDEIEACAQQLGAVQALDAFRLDIVAFLRQKHTYSCADLVNDFSGAIFAAGEARTPSRRSAIGRDPAFLKVREGSTNWGFGGDLTRDGESVFIAQPHDPWTGYYATHLSVDGAMEMFAVFFDAAIPSFYSWSNGKVAASATCHFGQPYAVYRLETANDNAYLYDSVETPFDVRDITLQATDANGEVFAYTHRFRRSVHGVLIDDPRFPTEAGVVYALRAVNEFRPDIGFLPLRQNLRNAETVEAVVAGVLQAERNDSLQHGLADAAGHVAAAPNDVVINLPDALWAACAAYSDVGAPGAGDHLPILDGGRSDCALPTGLGTKTSGVVARGDVPITTSRRAAIGANQSAFLFDPEQERKGYPRFIDARAVDAEVRRLARYPRALTHRALVEDRLSGRDGYDGDKWTSTIALERLFDSEGHWARMFRADVVKACKEESGDSLDGLSDVCTLLDNWDGRLRTDRRGAIFWRVFWTALIAEDDGSGDDDEYGLPDIFLVGSSIDDPYRTPRGLSEKGRQRVIANLLATKRLFAARKTPIDISVGESQKLAAEGVVAPVSGCHYSDGCNNFQVRFWQDPFGDNNAPLRQTGTPETYSGGNVTIAYDLRDSGVAIAYGGPAIASQRLVTESVSPDEIIDWASAGFSHIKLCADGRVC
ncbi:MAG: penicillin acylase family protein [Pseudomonadota bacterium]